MQGRHLGILVATSALWLTPALAQAQERPNGNAATNSELKEEVAQLRAEVEAMRAEMQSLRAAAASAQSTAATAQSAAVAAQSAAAAVQAPVAIKPKPDAVQASWKGAPEFKSDNGWSFKPRGRIQMDAAYLSAPADRFSGQADGRGFTSRLRRAYLGAQGTIPGGFSYRAEVDLANNAVNWTDLYLAYDTGPFTFVVGQHHPFTSMEQLQSDLFLSFNERASFISAFNFERRVGISAGFKSKTVLVNAGVFTDDITSLTNDGDKSVSYDGRIVWMPKFGSTQLHFGASAHYRDLGKFQASLGSRYRARPYVATTDIRYVDTGVLTVDKETHYGAEFALNRKRLHLQGEAAWLKADRPSGLDPTFFGGYAEAGLFLTDDSRTYRGGVFDRTSPKTPLGDGGIGAVEVNVRYDRLDLTDKNIGGGTQDGYGIGLVWVPVSYLRFMANYMHLIYDIPSSQPKFSSDTMGMRAQIDF